MVFAGRKVKVKRPRIRGASREMPLGTYQRFQEDGSLQRAVAKRLLLGVSARHYEGVLEDFCQGYGIKKSSVSRRWVKATAQALQELCERPLGDREWVVLIIDGIDFEGCLLVVALGIDKDGNKQALGIWQGATENAVVVTALLEDLVRRGLDPEGRYLFVLDGSKALIAGVRRVFGEDAEVQRCQLHKRRNVKEHLPPEHRGAIEARMRAAYGMATYEEANASLERTIEYLERLNPSAARSLQEGLEETLTLHRLGVADALGRSLCSTNLLESGLAGISDFTGRVKRWRGGEQVQRWPAAALLEGEKRWKRVRGYMPSVCISRPKPISRFLTQILPLSESCGTSLTVTGCQVRESRYPRGKGLKTGSSRSEAGTSALELGMGASSLYLTRFDFSS